MLKHSFKKWICIILAVSMVSLSASWVVSGAETGSTAAADAAEDAAEAASEAAEDAAEAASESAAEAASKAAEDAAEAASESAAEAAEDAAEAAEDAAEDAAEAVEKNGEIFILCTSDMHCGVDDGFGLAGLEQIRNSLEAQGYETLLVDDGDAIQGNSLGTLSKGEAVVDLMNEMDYDVAIPGNHEFDYGMDRFLELVDHAEYPYISCNFTYEGNLVFKPYVIKEVAGKKIAFVGVTTPKTITSSTPKYFKNDKNEFVYGFMEDSTGEKLYQAVQTAVDDAKKEGADLVYVMGHMGNESNCAPWTYTDVISHTNGIDVFLDGHSHDTDQVVMKNKDGEDVSRCAVGTKLNCIGYSHISAEGEILETNIWSWPNEICAPTLLNIHNEIRDEVDEAKQELAETLNVVVANSDVYLTIADPVEKDESGNPIRMIRRAETNLGDFCADAYRDQMEADVAICNGGSIRTNIDKGDITYEEIINVHPFGNNVCMIEATGQQILDALEWGARGIPDEIGAFLQVSGLTYEINSKIASPCKSDEASMFAGIEGERRVQNVKIGGEALDPEKTYKLTACDYIVLNQGDGYTMFDGAKVLNTGVLDSQVLIDYITNTLNGKVGEEYADPYGQGRIKIIDD